MNELLVLLLPLAAFSGWWLARKDEKSDSEQKTDDYFQGLGYLLEDETDKAIDIFVRIAHLDDSTVENQITLGNLFRYRGEVDRALHVHSTLSKKSSLPPVTEQKLHLALADDYLAAGIMNHAADYFIKTSEGSQNDIRQTAQKRLIALYAEQAEWQKAIDVGEALDGFKRNKIQQQIAHFHCEIAKQRLANNDIERAKKQLEKALTCDKNCVRATLELGRLAASQGNYVDAINQFNQLEKQNPAFLPEILDDFANCYTALNQQHEWCNNLERMANTYHNPVLILHYNQSVGQIAGNETAKTFLQQRLQKHPNILSVQAYLRLLDDQTSRTDIKILRESVDKVLSHALKYRCRECGFRGNELIWLCPGCKNWGCFTPIADLSLKENIA